MKTENAETLKGIIKELEQFKSDIYDYDYDRDVLWCIQNALIALKNI